MKKKILLFIIGNILLYTSIYAQDNYSSILPDYIYQPSIRTVKLFPTDNQLAYPIINLGVIGGLELRFDDLNTNNIPYYYYTFQLCNADWTPVNSINPSEYIQGFVQDRIAEFHYSNLSSTKYINYHLVFPTASCVPRYAGNYLLVVFLNGDPTQIVFTKRFLIVDNEAGITTSITQPYNPDLYNIGQQLNFAVDVGKLNNLSAVQQIKVVVLKNYRWDIARIGMSPSFIQDNVVQFNNLPALIFQGGNEYRWVDLRSFRFNSERIKKTNLNQLPWQVWVNTDKTKASQPYSYYPDLNGFCQISNTDYVNSWWETDYAMVHFTYATPNQQPLLQNNLYLVGQFVDMLPPDSCLMYYDDTLGMYEKTLYLKQGFYSYCYNTQEINSNKNAPLVSNITEGDFWETENDYTVLVYYRSPIGLYDQLLGVSTINSRNSRLNSSGS